MKKILQKQIRQFLLSVITFFFSIGIISGQGWENTYNGGIFTWAGEVVTTSDGNMIVSAASIDGLSFGDWAKLLIKLDNDGNTLWVKIISENYPSLGVNDNVTATNDGGVIWGEGAEIGLSSPRLLKVDTDGNFEWDITYNSLSTGELSIIEIIQVADGGFMVLGENETDEQPYLAKVDANGNVLWFQQFNFNFNAQKFLETQQQEILISGQNDSFALTIIKTDATGNILWTESTGDPSHVKEMGEASDGSILILGSTQVVKLDNQGTLLWAKDHHSSTDAHYLPDEGFISTSLYNPFFDYSATGIRLTRTDMNGDIVWEKLYNYREGRDEPGGVTATADGGFAVAGFAQFANPFGRYVYVIKTDEDGNVFGNEIRGTIKNDENQNCVVDSTESPVGNWIVTATRPGKTFSTMSDYNGNYFLPVDTGLFELTITPPVNYWSVCNNNISINFPDILNVDTVNFSVQATIDCSHLEVGGAIPFLRPCFDNSPYKVSWCNSGTIESEDAYIEVVLDSAITPISSTVPWTSQNGDTLIFELGNIQSGECGDILMNLMLDCDATLGAAYCIESRIYPDSLCFPPEPNWDGAFVEISGACQDSSVIFQIENTGIGDMTQDGDYIIVEDAVLLLHAPFNLLSGQTAPVSFPANGSTYFLMATQEPFAPGNPFPVAALEGCGTNGSGNFSVSFLNQFSQGDEDPTVDIDCRVATSSFDPNDKQGFPIGYESEHFIAPNTPLEYLVRFQNTGTDTAFTVVIRDTLSEHLDITTLRQGVGSHDYDLKLLGENIIEFTFFNIMLPDSNINESASHGFIEFKIAQKEDLPLGTVIKNKAAIYFDFNEPIITNETFHTIGINFITVSLQKPIVKDYSLKVRPNPMQDFAIFEMEKEIRDGTFELYDVNGKQVWQQEFNGNQFELHRNAKLNSGIYFYKISEKGNAINSGKIIIN